MIEFAPSAEDKEKLPLSDLEEDEIRYRWDHDPQYRDELLLNPVGARESLRTQRELDTKLTSEEEKALFEVLGPNWKKRRNSMSVSELKVKAIGAITAERRTEENARRVRERERQEIIESQNRRPLSKEETTVLNDIGVEPISSLEAHSTAARMLQAEREAAPQRAKHQKKTALSKKDLDTLEEAGYDRRHHVRPMSRGQAKFKAEIEQLPRTNKRIETDTENLSPHFSPSLNKDQIPIDFTSSQNEELPEPVDSRQTEVAPVETLPQETFFGAKLQEALDNGAIPKLNKEKPPSKKKGRKSSKRVGSKKGTEVSTEVETGVQAEVEKEVEIENKAEKKKLKEFEFGKGPKIWRQTFEKLAKESSVESTPISPEELNEREKQRIALYGGVNAYRKYQSLLENSNLLRRQMENTMSSSLKEERYRNWDKQKRIGVLFTEDALRKEYRRYNPEQEILYEKDDKKKHSRIAHFMSEGRTLELLLREPQERKFEKLAIALENQNEAALRFYKGDAEAIPEFNFWEDKVNKFRDKMNLTYSTLVKIVNFSELEKYKEEQRGRRGRTAGEAQKEPGKKKEEKTRARPVKSPQWRKGVIPRRIYEGSALEDDEQEYKLKHMPEKPRSADIPPRAEEKPEPTPKPSGENESAEEYWDNLLPRAEGVRTEEATQKTNVAPSEFGGDLLIQKLKREKFGPSQGEVPPTVETVPPKTGGPLWSGERPPIIDTRPPIVESKGPLPKPPDLAESSSATEVPPKAQKDSGAGKVPPAKKPPVGETPLPPEEKQTGERVKGWLKEKAHGWYIGDRIAGEQFFRNFFNRGSWERYDKQVNSLAQELAPITVEIRRLEARIANIDPTMRDIERMKGTAFGPETRFKMQQEKAEHEERLRRKRNEQDKIQTKLENAQNRRSVVEWKRNEIATRAIERVNKQLSPYENELAQVQESKSDLDNEIANFKDQKKKIEARLAGAEFDFERDAIREVIKEMDKHINRRVQRRIKIEADLADVTEDAGLWQDMRTRFARITQRTGVDTSEIAPPRTEGEPYYRRGPEGRTSPIRPVTEAERESTVEEADDETETGPATAEEERMKYTPDAYIATWNRFFRSDFKFTKEDFRRANQGLPMDKEIDVEILGQALFETAALLAQEGRPVPKNLGKFISQMSAYLE